MLSDGSPIRAWTWITRDGSTPNFSTTAFSSTQRSFMVSSMTTLSLISCMRSLSEEMMTTRSTSLAYLRARVAMMSSASTPGILMADTLKAAMTSSMRGNWTTRSSGMGGRLALYSGYISCRKVGPGASRTMAT